MLGWGPQDPLTDPSGRRQLDGECPRGQRPGGEPSGVSGGTWRRKGLGIGLRTTGKHGLRSDSLDPAGT